MNASSSTTSREVPAGPWNGAWSASVAHHSRIGTSGVRVKVPCGPFEAAARRTGGAVRGRMRRRDPRRVAREQAGQDGRTRHGARRGRRHAARPPRQGRPERAADGPGQARDAQPRRERQGPHRPADDRGGRTRRPPEAGRHDRRADLRQHGARARDRRRDPRVPVHLRDARQDEPGEDLAPAGVRRRGRDLPDRRPARVPGVLLPRRRPPRRGDPRRVPAEPVLQPREPGRALRDHRPRDLAPDRRDDRRPGGRAWAPAARSRAPPGT